MHICRIPRTLVALGFAPSSRASWEPKQPFILLKWNSYSSLFQWAFFISIHKKEKKKRKKENFLWPMEKIIHCFAYWHKAWSFGPGCEREGRRFSWKGSTPPTHVCVSLRLTQPPTPTPTARYIPLVAVPTTNIQIAWSAEALESYRPY